jgi:hypothetical protein
MALAQDAPVIHDRSENAGGQTLLHQCLLGNRMEMSMVTRREVLILGLTAPWLSACGGGSKELPPGGRADSPTLFGHAALADQGTYGTRIANWERLRLSAGVSSLTSADLPPAADAVTSVLELRQSAGGSFGEQDAPVVDPAFVPKGTTPGFSAGIWVKNPNPRTLNFDLSVIDASGKHKVDWHCAIEPTNSWVFLTLSPSQQFVGNWPFGQAAIGAVRVSQDDDGPEGAWLPGETLLFGNVYADVSARPLFMITFDDGFDTQRNAHVPRTSSRPAYVKSASSTVFTTAARHHLIMGAPIVFTDIAPNGLVTGQTYWVQSVLDPASFTLAMDEALTKPAISTGFTGVANYKYAGNQFLSGQQIVESYGFKGNLFIVPSWLGTSGVYGYGSRANKFMSAADAKAMHSDGWSVGSHSNTHPSSLDNAGLRLLGPYGYFLSNTVDKLPASYVSVWQLGAANRRRAIQAAAGTNIVTFENPHQFLVNMPIIFTDAAPSGLSIGTTYYCQSIPSPTMATFAIDQGSRMSTALIISDWSGMADYRFAGASNDDTAIYADIQAGVAGVTALGIPTGSKFFALPQGSADVYVRSACIRAGLRWVRGASLHTHTIPVGLPSGGGLSGIQNTPGGWLAQPDCVQTDGAAAPSIAAIKAYIDDAIIQGACGCSYHHEVGAPTLSNLDNMCMYLRDRVNAKLIDVVTLDQMAERLQLG